MAAALRGMGLGGRVAARERGQERRVGVDDPLWVSVDAKKMEGSLKTLPDRSDYNQEVNESLIVELYSR